VKRTPHVTLDDIAQKLKVSRVTVSKALRGHSDISEETSKRVHKVAKELGYSPNYMARNLSARRSHMIGLVVPKIAHFFFGSMIEAVYNTAFNNNYETILTVSLENAERERKHIQTLISMRVDGIIVSISQETKNYDIFHWVKKMGVPLIFVDRMPDPPIPGFCSVLVDDRSGSFQAVEHAIRNGYRKIGFLGGNPQVNIGKNRLAGFEDAMTKYEVPFHQEWIIPGGFGKDDGYKGFMQLYKNGNMPEFLFTVTYPVALGVYEAAKEVGVKIPDDIDLICFGDSDLSHLLSPALSCVTQPTLQLGTSAVETMLDIIRNPDINPDRQIIIPTGLMLRETCRPRQRKTYA
jgi:LacI family transcriptional regulator